MQLCKSTILVLTITVLSIFSRVDIVQAGSGIYPNSPRQIAPLEYGGGNTTIEFTFSSYNSYFTNENGTFFGFPIAYHIEIYEGENPISIVNDDVWSTTASYNNFITDTNSVYTWRVYAIYEFYDEYAEYAGMEYSEVSSATFLNIPATTPSVPKLIFPLLDLQTQKDSFVGGKRGAYFWNSVPGAQYYQLDVAKDADFTKIIASHTAESFVVLPGSPIADLPADGSRIFWRLKAHNEFGWSGYSQTASFINDCSMQSIGTGGAFSHIDTCTDDVTRIGGNYFLKDMSRRYDYDDHGHHGKMKKEASIITGFNSDNTVSGVERGKGVQIAPITDLNNKWDEATVQDAIHAQHSPADFTTTC